MEKQYENKIGNIQFSKPVIVTYTYRWLCLFKMYNTVVVKARTVSPILPATASEEELKKKIKEMTGHEVISVISKASF